MELRETQTGWVIITIDHPINGKTNIVPGTFQSLRKDAISKFTEGTNATWEFWKKHYNFRCVKAESIIRTI